MTNDEVIDVSNNLTNENLRFLLDIMSERLMVYCGTIDNRCLSDEVRCCTLNGGMVQINLMNSQKDLRENASWHRMLYGTNPIKKGDEL
jgi:hypothetical protein